MNSIKQTSSTTQQTNLFKVPIWFWVVSIMSLLWFLMDFSAFVMRVFMLDNMIAEMPVEQKNLYLTMPAWVNIVFAIEAIGGLLGCIGLIIKKRWAFVLFVVSIIGVLAQTFYVYFQSEAIALMGAQAIMMPLVAIIIGSSLIFFTKLAISKSWIK